MIINYIYIYINSIDHYNIYLTYIIDMRWCMMHEQLQSAICIYLMDRCSGFFKGYSWSDVWPAPLFSSGFSRSTFAFWAFSMGARAKLSCVQDLLGLSKQNQRILVAKWFKMLKLFVPEDKMLMPVYGKRLGKICADAGGQHEHLGLGRAGLLQLDVERESHQVDCDKSDCLDTYMILYNY